MTWKTLFIAALVLALPVFAQAQTTVTTTQTTTAGKTGSTGALSKSDEDFLSEMPMEDFPGADEMADKDNDGIADGDQAGFDPTAGLAKEDKPAVKYVYKPTSNTTLRHTIEDDRVEDGYVQGLMQQNTNGQ